MGVVAPCGIGPEAYWQGLLSTPEPGLRRVEDFDPAPYFDNAKEVRRADRFAQLGLAAAAMALDQAGDLRTNPARIGVNIATGIGGLTTLEEQILVNYQKDSRRVSPFLVPMMMANAATASISMRWGFQGPCENTVTACAAGTHSIGNGTRLIQHGVCDVVIAGGSEASLCQTAMAGFTNMTALSSSGVSRPFDRDRDGFVIAEAAGILVLEEWDMAVARGATILAEVLGSSSTADAHHITAPAPGGSGAIRCMRQALADAGVTAAEVRHVNAHGTSTPLNDAAEAAAMAEVFGDLRPIVTSTKGVTGHALGAAGAIEAIAVVLSMQHKLIPPTDGHVNDDPDMPSLDLVLGQARPWEPGVSISNSFGFGGHNGTVVLRPA